MEKHRPEISPEMIKEVFRTLEEKGMVYYSEGDVYVPTEKGWQLFMESGKAKEEIVGYGNPKITASSLDSVLITRNAEPRRNTDAVIVVKANKSCSDLSEKFVHAIKTSSKIHITIEAEDVSDSFVAYGSPALRPTSKEDILITKNDRIDSRTVAIVSSKSANEIKQELVEKLRDSNTQVKVILEIK